GRRRAPHRPHSRPRAPQVPRDRARLLYARAEARSATARGRGPVRPGVGGAPFQFMSALQPATTADRPSLAARPGPGKNTATSCFIRALRGLRPGLLAGVAL